MKRAIITASIALTVLANIRDAVAQTKAGTTPAPVLDPLARRSFDATTHNALASLRGEAGQSGGQVR
jgi:hypothetical protein